MSPENMASVEARNAHLLVSIENEEASQAVDQAVVEAVPNPAEAGPKGPTDEVKKALDRIEDKEALYKEAKAMADSGNKDGAQDLLNTRMGKIAPSKSDAQSGADVIDLDQARQVRAERSRFARVKRVAFKVAALVLATASTLSINSGGISEAAGLAGHSGSTASAEDSTPSGLQDPIFSRVADVRERAEDERRTQPSTDLGEDLFNAARTGNQTVNQGLRDADIDNSRERAALLKAVYEEDNSHKLEPNNINNEQNRIKFAETADEYLTQIGLAANSATPEGESYSDDIINAYLGQERGVPTGLSPEEEFKILQKIFTKGEGSQTFLTTAGELDMRNVHNGFIGDGNNDYVEHDTLDPNQRLLVREVDGKRVVFKIDCGNVETRREVSEKPPTEVTRQAQPGQPGQSVEHREVPQVEREERRVQREVEEREVKRVITIDKDKKEVVKDVVIEVEKEKKVPPTVPPPAPKVNPNTEPGGNTGEPHSSGGNGQEPSRPVAGDAPASVGQEQQAPPAPIVTEPAPTAPAIEGDDQGTTGPAEQGAQGTTTPAAPINSGTVPGGE